MCLLLEAYVKVFKMLNINFIPSIHSTRVLCRFRWKALTGTTNNNPELIERPATRNAKKVRKLQEFDTMKLAQRIDQTWRIGACKIQGYFDPPDPESANLLNSQ